MLAWIGLPLRWPGNASGVDLADGAVRQAISAFCARLVHEMGFDGVHLDPEPVADGDSHLLDLLSETRRSIGAQPMLSIATPHIWPLFPDVSWPLVGRVMWLGDYYRQVAARVDQIALMTYDSALPLDSLYRGWTRFQVIALSSALAKTSAEVLIGIPTSEEQTATHLPGAENMTSGLLGLLDSLNDAASHPEAITGTAIYPYWETDEREWAVYRAEWLGEKGE
ncbi:MAG: glycosyl hydrolase family 18 protein [Chloroflexi bacterium]|nr:glycosyl hydrolase family 18 protein [Chloroflexota bacterium]